jgi:NADH-quinone oxidoreductase subunit M
MLLTAFITVIVVIAGWEVIQSGSRSTWRLPDPVGPDDRRVRGPRRHAVLRVLRSNLIPMYIVIGIWGGPNRVYAAFKFFLYTLLGSLLTLVALIYLYVQTGFVLDPRLACGCR